jgi:hypothetical protein
MSKEDMQARNPFTPEDLEEARHRAELDTLCVPLAEIWRWIRKGAVETVGGHEEVMA